MVPCGGVDDSDIVLSKLAVSKKLVTDGQAGGATTDDDNFVVASSSDGGSCCEVSNRRDRLCGGGRRAVGKHFGCEKCKE